MLTQALQLHAPKQRERIEARRKRLAETRANQRARWQDLLDKGRARVAEQKDGAAVWFGLEVWSGNPWIFDAANLAFDAADGLLQQHRKLGIGLLDLDRVLKSLVVIVHR